MNDLPNVTEALWAYTHDAVIIYDSKPTRREKKAGHLEEPCKAAYSRQPLM
jgi:hypothetical protein